MTAHHLKYIRPLLNPFCMSRCSMGGARKEITAKAPKKEEVRASTPSPLLGTNFSREVWKLGWPPYGMESPYCQNIITSRAHDEETTAHPLEIFASGSLFVCNSKRECFNSLPFLPPTILMKRKKRSIMKAILVVTYDLEWERSVLVLV